MTMRAADFPWRHVLPARHAPGPFQLKRYFTATSLVAFIVLALSLYFLERSEQNFFRQVQQEQSGFFAQVQHGLLREQKETARGNLVKAHEAGHVTLAKVFANALWASRFAPLVGRVQAIPLDACRKLDGGAGGTPPAAALQQECFSRLRAQVMALPGFADADASARALMRKTTVFKVKVYDLRGHTVYASAAAQVGEDKAGNAGWQMAAAGKPASELVHRNRFSAFEGVVEDRDLIQSYVPVLAADGRVQGVFEIYSDVTPLLQQIDAASQRIAEAIASNQARVEAAAASNLHIVEAGSTHLLLIVGVLLAFIYAALLMLVRNGQRIIDEEARAREQAVLREQEWHRDKMATMAAMAANISHEVGNPLAIIAGLADEVALWRDASGYDPQAPRMIHEQTARIAGMTRRITDFATAGHEAPEPLDVNQLVKAVCDFLAFDRRFRGTPIELRLAGQLPACEGIPDHLTEILMSLLQALEEASEKCPGPDKRIFVESAAGEAEVKLRIGCECGAIQNGCRLPPADSRMESARRRLQAMGGRLAWAGGALEIDLRRCLG
jgi:signal transduction histidine kinase